MCSIMGLTRMTVPREILEEHFEKTKSRGPDMSRIEEAGEGILCFHRLAIMGLHEEGMQPFHLKKNAVICNGEIYGFRKLKRELEKEYSFGSESDCEILLPLYEKYGTDMFPMLGSEFALIIYDGNTHSLFPAFFFCCSNTNTVSALIGTVR